MISFKVKAYSFKVLMKEPLSCDDLNFNINYNIPTVSKDSRVPLPTICSEINGALNYTLYIDPNPESQLQKLLLENS